LRRAARFSLKPGLVKRLRNPLARSELGEILSLAVRATRCHQSHDDDSVNYEVTTKQL